MRTCLTTQGNYHSSLGNNPTRTCSTTRRKSSLGTHSKFSFSYMTFNDSSLVASRRTVARLRRSVRDIIRLFRRLENILTC